MSRARAEPACGPRSARRLAVVPRDHGGQAAMLPFGPRGLHARRGTVLAALPGTAAYEPGQA